MLAEGRPRPGARPGRALSGAAVAAACVLLLGAGCRRGAASSFRGAPIVLISVDTLRADHLPAYGYRNVDTPNLDALRRDSVLFENAYSHVPLTLPSHTTIFTGLLPPQNGVRDNLGYALAATPATLAGTLRSHGYATAGAVSSIVLSHATGIARGFDFWEDNVEPTRMSQAIGRVQRPGDETEELLAGWVGEHEKQARPFLAFLHLFEPHTPYEPPEPYLSRYKLPYDGEIARADEIVGTFVRFLKDQGLYDRAVVVFLSDHGEGLDDHGEDEHGVLLYREAIHVPLMVKLPRQLRGGASVASPAALTDVFPTVLELAGLPPLPGLAGRSLGPELRGEAAPASAGRRIYGETLYPRLHLGWSDLSSLVDARNQYIESPKPELYDIVADPGEKNDLAAGLPPAFRSMRAELSRIARPYQAPGATDAEQVKKLASLGYISASSTGADDAKDLPPPRDRIGNVSSLKRGFTALQTGRYDEAARLLGELLKKEPKMLDVWQMYAEACQHLGRDADALAALQNAARLSPGNPQILMALSDYYMSVGKFDEARRHAEAVGDAGTASPHEILARIALAEGNLPEAEKEARAALERYPQKRVPRLILARVLHDRRDCAGALAELDQARRPRGKESVVAFQNLNYLRGDCLARMGRAAEAEAAFREEIEKFPGSAAARAGLAMLYASQGREADARGALGSLVTDVATPDAYFAAIRTYEILGDPGTANELKRDLQRKFPGAKERKG
jgi:arylsulfatase A-like enzyme/tetratricopeptide (TPR) repeat protein